MEAPLAVYYLMLRCFHRKNMKRPSATNLVSALSVFIKKPAQFGIEADSYTTGKVSMKETYIEPQLKRVSKLEFHLLVERGGAEAMPPYKRF